LRTSDTIKIAIIDDNADSRFIFRTYLEGTYDVIEFPNGDDAIMGMKTSPPDLAFLDISLPGVDGFEILRRIRSDERLHGLPVFALTAHAMSGDRERFLKFGFDGYLSKPILDLKTLTSIIEAAAPRSADQKN
jgi:CheY-like chemotaxis protein